MKKIISLGLCAIMIILTFSGCSGPNADMTEENITETVEVVETALKEFNTKDLEKYVDSATLSTIIGYAESRPQFSELGKAIFANLEMEIKEIDTENSTVTVSVNNKDLYATATEFASDLKSQYSSIQLFRKLSDSEFLDRKLAILLEDIDQCQMSENPIEIKLTIEQSKKNLVLVFDEEGENAVSGGALAGIRSIYS